MGLESKIGFGEGIVWQGRPDRKCFALESVFNPLLPFAIIWALVDIPVIVFTLVSGDVEEIGIVLMFFLVHMAPVWIYLAGVFTVFKKFKHEEYLITDRCIYLSTGRFSVSYDKVLIEDITDVSFHRGFFDKRLGVGDVVIDAGRKTVRITDIPDYKEVAAKIKDLYMRISR